MPFELTRAIHLLWLISNALDIRFEPEIRIEYVPWTFIAATRRREKLQFMRLFPQEFMQHYSVQYLQLTYLPEESLLR